MGIVGAAARTTFADYGRALGLSDAGVIDALCIALELVGPSVGGRFLGPHHPIEDDEPSRVASDLLRVAATRTVASARMQ